VEKQPNQKVLSGIIWKNINSLQSSGNDSHIRASLANLRRGIGKKPGSLPEIWEFTLEGLPENPFLRNDEPSREEWAAHIAMTLFALHQQGKSLRDSPMSVSGQSLGIAVNRLVAKRDSSEDAIQRRFHTVVTSDSLEELTHHLRGLIQLLKSEGIPLDYPKLAEDLYQYQSADARDGVRLRWGREYYRIRKDEQDNEN
jgi:CRISPR system Cascade subunit CasB